MDNLEITVIGKSDLLKDNEAFRIDSEFNLKMYLAAICTVKKKGAEKFEMSNPLIIHPQEIVRNYSEEDNNGIWFFRAQNLRPMQINENNKVFISGENAAQLIKNRILPGDVLITRTGANRGDCAYFNLKGNALASSHTFIVRSKRWSHPFLVAFFNSLYGRLQIDKGVYGAAQPEVAPYYLRKIFIPKISSDFQSVIDRYFDKTTELTQEALEELNKGEHVLLQFLGLEDWQPPEPLTYVRRASDAFASERLDAEHFHPKFDNLIDAIKNRSIPLVPLADLIMPIRNGYDYRNFVDIGTPYIRVGDIKNCRIDIEGAEKISINLKDINKDIDLKVGDVLFTRKGSFGNAAPVREGEEHSVISSEIMLIRRKKNHEQDILPEFLALFFNSIVGNYQAEKWAHGAAFYSISQDDLYKFQVPILSLEAQLRMREMVDNAEFARRDSNHLLDRAKHAIEIAIEQGEAAAMEYLDGAKE